MTPRSLPPLLSVLAVGAVLLVGGALSLDRGSSRPAPSATPSAASLTQLPLSFVENRGQWPARVRFVAQRGRLAATFERDAVKLSLGRAPLGLRFEGAAPARLVGERPRGARYNFFLGNDPSRWRSNVRAYSSVLYQGLYQGIDLRVREDAPRLEYDLLVAPGADPGRVVVRTEGTSRLALGRDGGLLMRTGRRTLRQAPPVAWQVLPGGVKQPVLSRFRLIDEQRYGFEAPGRDPALPLVIDPGLDWATFLGGNGDETIEGLEIASGGEIVVAGQTWSPDFPHTGGNLVPIGATPYVARLNASGTALVYATFFGGTFNHSVLDLALDSSGRPAIVGDTNSLDFPTTEGAYDRTPGDGFHGDYDAYVIQFNASGSGLVFGTYLGSSPNSANFDQAWAVGFEPTGSVVVAGQTSGADFPTTTGAYDRTYAGGRDIFLSRLNPTGSQLTYSSFLGGAGYDEVFAMAVDPQGFVNLTGKVSGAGSPTFPTTSNGFDRTYDSQGDGYLSRFKLDGGGAADLRYSTFLGGSQWTEAGTGIAVDPNDPVSLTVAGWTRSGDFPTTAGALQRTHLVPIDGSMAFVSRFRFPTGGSPTLAWSTLYGGPGNQAANDVVVDSIGAAIIAAGTAVNNPATTERAYDRVPGLGLQGKPDGLVARISANGSQLLYSTLLGGESKGDVAWTVGYAGGTSVIVGGLTNSTDFPVTAGAFDTVYAADGLPSDRSSNGTLADDAYVARLTLEAPSGGDTTPPPASELRGPPNATTYTAPTYNVTFDWGDAPDPSGIEAYHIQISPNSTFTNDINAELTGWAELWVPTSLVVKDFNVSQVGTFYWRVQALDGAGNLGPWSAVRTITVNSPTPPPAPTLVSPPNAGFFGPGNIIFAWSRVTVANYYIFQVDTTTSFSNPVIWVQGISQTQHTVSLTTQGHYFWRVKGANNSTIDGAWSVVRSFDIQNGSPPAPPPPLPPPPPGGTSLAAIDLNPTSAYPGGTSQGTVWLNYPAPAGGALVPLASQYPDRATVPASVTVPAGSMNATFTVTALSPPTSSLATISGEYGGVTQGANLTVLVISAAELYTMSIGGTTVNRDTGSSGTHTMLGGGTVQGSVAFPPGWTAGPAGAVVTLGTTNPALASVPDRVTIPAGGNSASFTVTTQPVASMTRVTVLAARSWRLDITLELLPPSALQSLALNPTTVVGGNPSQGTVTLAGAAPTGGVVVALSVINPEWAQVPPSVTVPAGASSANFTVTTSPNNTGQGQFSIIVATAGGIERSQSINVNPGPPPPPPPPGPPPPPPPPGPPPPPPPPGDTGLLSPTANSAVSDGDRNGFESSPGNAHADGGGFAVDNNSGDGSSTSCTSSSKDKHLFRDYGFSIPGTATIRGIQVRLDAKVDSTSSSPKMCVQLSWNGGSSWTSAKSTATLTTTEASYTLGSATDTWGRTWSADNFSNASFRVRVINVSSSTSRDFSLDWVAVRVYT